MDKFPNHSHSDLITEIDQKRMHRLKALIKVMTAALLILFIVNILIYQQSYELVLFATAVIFAALYFYINQDTVPIVAGMFIWTLTGVASYFAWLHEGLYDTALFAYPCILMFAAMLNGRILIVANSLYMVTTIYVYTYAEIEGYFNTPIAEYVTWRKAHNITLILVVYSVIVNVISNDLRHLVDRIIRAHTNALRTRIRAEKKAITNKLSNLPNETACASKMSKRHLAELSNNQIQALLIMQIDNLSAINASLGYDIGDKLLKQLALRLNSQSTDATCVFHTSDNEFLITFTALDYHDVEALAHQILQATFYTNYVDDYEVEVSASIGIATYPVDGESFAVLRRRAHIALADAKTQHQDHFCFFDIEMEQRTKNRLTLVTNLKRAIENNEFQLHYQPKIDLHTGKTVGAEALLRWVTDSGDIIRPDHFIPIAEASGLINEIGTWVIKQAIHDCKDWHEQGLSKLVVAVNVSPIQFKKGNLSNIILKALRDAQLDPSYFDIEITESLFIDDEEYIQQQIHQMAAKGVAVSIDDFGTGYSNLNYLTKFNASTLKIDQSFVREMLESEQKLHVVNAIIQMSIAMDIENTAEGIEDETTATILKKLGCRYGQGYYWSKPLPIEQFNALLQKRRS